MNEEKKELQRLCEKIVLSFNDIEQLNNLLTLNDRFDYHESTNRFDLEIFIKKRKQTVDEMLKRKEVPNYGTMELIKNDKKKI